MCKEKGDISICDSYFEDKIIKDSKDNTKVLILSAQEAIQKLLLRKDFSVTVWGKLYVRNIFENRRFPEGHLSEDLAIIPDIICGAKKVIYVKKPLYYYRQRNGSICEGKSEKLLNDNLLFAELQKNKLLEKYPKLQQEIITDFVKVNISIFLDTRECGIEERTIKHIREYGWNVLQYSSLSKKYKILLFSSICIPKISKKLYKIRRKWNE